MRAVWKFPLDLAKTQIVYMPLDAQMLHVAVQGDNICLWAGVDPSLHEEAVEPRMIQIVGTGAEELPDAGAWHLGSVQMGPFVWHVFEIDL